MNGQPKTISSYNGEDEDHLVATTQTPLGTVQVGFHSNNERTCFHCKIPITEENDSGWECFTGRTPGETQAECKVCEKTHRGPYLSCECSNCSQGLAHDHGRTMEEADQASKEDWERRKDYVRAIVTLQVPTDRFLNKDTSDTMEAKVLLDAPTIEEIRAKAERIPNATILNIELQKEVNDRNL